MSTKRTPPRVAARPDPRDWGEDELLTLPETAALFWPDGPLTTHSVVAGRYMTTRRAVSEMSKCARLSEHGGSSN
jgi:hypothetical protein